MAGEPTDSDCVIRIYGCLKSEQMQLDNPDPFLLESMETFAAKFGFLAMFLGYTQRWSDAHEVVPDLDSLVVRIAAAAKAFRKELHSAYTCRCDYISLAKSSEYPAIVSKLWRRVFRSEPTPLLDLFARLNDMIELLKSEIREAYGSWSNHPFHPLPPTMLHGQTYDWVQFCESVEQNLEFIRKKHDFVGPPGKHMEALIENLFALRQFHGCKYYSRYSSREEDMLLARRGEVVIRAAHVCCLYYYAELDQNVENDTANLLADLQQKIDLASPEFLECILEFLRYHAGCTTHFLRGIVGCGEKIELENQLFPLVTWALSVMKMETVDFHSLLADIRDLLVRARNLRNSDYRECKIDHVLLLARIWFLKADIFCKEQLCGRTHSRLAVKSQTTFLQDGSRSLEQFFTPPKEKTESQMLALIKQLRIEVRDVLHQSSHAEESIANKVRDVLYKFLVQIMLFKAKELLSDLLNRDASFMVDMKHQTRTLHEGLVLVIEIASNQFKEITEDEKQTMTYAENVAEELISLCNYFAAEETTEEAKAKLDLGLFDLLQKVQVLKTKLKELYLQVPRLNFPKIPGLGFMEFLQKKLRQLLLWNLDSVAHVTHQIETIFEDIELLISNFRNFKGKGIENQELKDLCTGLIHVAYEAEYVIDSLVVQSGDEWNSLLWLYHVSEKIGSIKMQVKNFQDKPIDVGHQKAIPTTAHEISQAGATGNDEVMVVLSDQQKAIVDRLTRGLQQRDIVSIVGMPGIGKTTLANKLYNDPTIVSYFHIRTRCYVSQVYTKRDMLLQILSHILERTDNIFEMKNEDLQLLLYQSLRRNRYLIIMDDMWSIGVWDDLQSSFPDDRNGSRILITSRCSDVVSRVTQDTNLFNLRPLSDDESWELLRMKLFPKQCCSEELWAVGMEIARNCQGLPLSVVAIAGLLKERNMKPDSWKQIAQSLNSLIVNDPQLRCMDILELSYENLPDYLKACFIFFGAFQEEKEIPVRKLTWLWMAEGFIQDNSKNLEDLAEDYLIDLIGRNLITVAKRRSDGGVKSCRAHGLVRAFCLLKAKQENFFKLITCDDEPYASFDDNIDLEDIEPSHSLNYEEHRLYISLSRNHFVKSRPTGSFVRSLLLFATADIYPTCPYDISFISRNFKLLKVLDLECINMGNSFATGIDSLIQLNYLAVGGDIDNIPSSLANLRNLETFLVKGLKGKVILPDTIWHMARLRHLHVKNRVSFSLQDEEIESSTRLNNLVLVTLLSLSFGEHGEEIIRRLPNLRRLSCIFSKLENDSMNCNNFPRLKELTKLEALRILYRGKSLNVSEFNFPLSLKKLSLSNFFLRGDHISTIGNLVNLAVLKLSSVVLEDSNWKMIEGEFLQLKFLKLECVNIVEWNASSDHLPSLQQLVLQKCEHLKEVPIDFVDIETLKVIKVQQCRESVEMSLRSLKQEELYRYGANELKVLINH